MMDRGNETDEEQCVPYHVLYEDPSTHVITLSIFGTLYITIFLIGLIGNIIVIVATVYRPHFSSDPVA